VTCHELCKFYIPGLKVILGPPSEAIVLQEVLAEIVKEAHEFTTAANLSTALQSFSSDPSLQNQLPEAIGRLADIILQLLSLSVPQGTGNAEYFRTSR
jgi:hypothetical protein